jgi:hypothetical protein
MSYSLSKRTGHIGTSINGRREMHGEEPVPFMDVSFAILVTVAEAAKITGDTHLEERWFDTHDGKLAERALKDFKPYKLKGKFENSSALMWVGVNSVEIRLPAVRFASLGFDPQKVGSMVELKFKIQSPITNKNNEIFLWMDRDAEIELQFGELEIKEVQEELPFGAAKEEGGSNEGQSQDLDDDSPPATLEDAIAADAVCTHGTPMGESCVECDNAAKIGTPEQEREKARLREVEIANQLAADRAKDKPKRKAPRARGADAVN